MRKLREARSASLNLVSDLRSGFLGLLGHALLDVVHRWRSEQLTSGETGCARQLDGKNWLQMWMTGGKYCLSMPCE